VLGSATLDGSCRLAASSAAPIRSSTHAHIAPVCPSLSHTSTSGPSGWAVLRCTCAAPRPRCPIPMNCTPPLHACTCSEEPPSSIHRRAPPSCCDALLQPRVPLPCSICSTRPHCTPYAVLPSPLQCPVPSNMPSANPGGDRTHPPPAYYAISAAKNSPATTKKPTLCTGTHR
jgi:hypothetical protein